MSTRSGTNNRRGKVKKSGKHRQDLTITSQDWTIQDWGIQVQGWRIIRQDLRITRLKSLKWELNSRICDPRKKLGGRSF